MVTIDVAAGEHATFATIRTDMPALHSVPLDDYITQGEALTAANGCVMALESQVAEATALNAALRNDLAMAIQSLAIERRNCTLLRDQLSAVRDENSDLHAALSKARQGANAP